VPELLVVEVVEYVCTPHSKSYEIRPYLYQASSDWLPAAEYSTSATGPVRAGGTTVPRTCLIRLSTDLPVSQNVSCHPFDAYGSATRPCVMYEAGAHMK